MIRINLQNLVVQLTRGNSKPSLVLAESIRVELGTILKSKTDTPDSPSHPAQQTLFAIDEVLLLIGEEDLRGALAAARDAAKEWRATPMHKEEQEGV